LEICLHYSLKPGSKITQTVSKEYNVFAYVIGGGSTIGKDNNKLLAKRVKW
jgi:redox-sensitive bicupin YhaK (pirin superfamily)